MEFIDLKAQYQAYKADIDREIAVVLDNAEFIGGRYVGMLEEELAAYVGRKHCIGCGNGTDALQLAYMAYGVKEGDAVFCPDMTFISSVEPAVMLGATPVFCDIDPVSYNIDPKDLEAKVIEVEKEGRLHPRFMVAVDFLGNPADYDAIEKVCKEHNLILIEDAAQGIGGIYKGRKLGSFGDIATTSFFPSKPLGCYGDGGAVFTDDDDVADLLRSIHVHGKGASKYDNVRIGMNSRLDNVQAAVLHVKLAHLEEEMLTRQEIARRYDEAFRGNIQYPVIAEGCRCAYAQYILLADSQENREEVMGRMKEAGIPSLLYYPKTMHAMKAFGYKRSDEFPNASSYAERNFGLPMSPFLTQDGQISVIDCVLNAVG